MRILALVFVGVVLAACGSSGTQTLQRGAVIGPAGAPGTIGPNGGAPVRPVTVLPRPIDPIEAALAEMESELGFIEILLAQSPPDTAALQQSFERLTDLGRWVAGQMPAQLPGGVAMPRSEYRRVREDFACLVDGFELLMLWSPPRRVDAGDLDLSRSVGEASSKD